MKVIDGACAGKSAQKFCKAAAAAILVFGLVACGGGGGGGEGGGGDNSNPPPAPAPPSYEFSSAAVGPGGDGANPKILRFTWEVDTAPDSFRLEVNPDGSSGYNSVLTAIPGSASSVELELESLVFTQWDHARYQLVAVKDGEDVEQSDALLLSDVENAQLVGYLKSSSPHESEWFGRDVALSADGKTLVIGTPYKDYKDTEGNILPQAGAAYVFSKGGEGWVLQQEIWADIPVESGGFGRAVAISADGNVAAIGAPFESYSEDEEIKNFSGAVYLFSLTAGSWEQSGKLVSTPTEHAQLGATVALSADGSLLAAGAPFYPLGASEEEGFVSIFDVASGSELDRMKASGDAEQRDRFGDALAMSADGGVVAVGAPERTVGESIWNGGAAYIYVQSESPDSWNLIKQYDAAAESESFGHSIALSADGGTLAVGSPSTTVDEQGNRGGATFVYRASTNVDGGLTWPESSSVVHFIPDRKNSRALALSADGGILAVGAQLANGDGKGVAAEHNESAQSSGAVYVYRHQEPAIYVKASNTEKDDLFGWSLALSADGNTLAVGASFEAGCGADVGEQGGQDNNECPAAGAIYLY